MEEQRSYRILAGRAADARGERERIALSVRNGRITGITEWSDALRPSPDDIEARQCLLLPGFVDIHVHGGAGRYVMEATAEALQAIARHLARHGVTGFLSTTVTGPWEQQAEAVAVADRALRSPENGRDGAAVLGSHLEGPYINPKRKGAQPGQYVRLPDVQDLVDHLGDHLSALRVVTSGA